MCDFHSVIVSTDGRVFHQPDNSHSGIASHYDLANTPELRQYYECEWDGIGEMPLALVRDRNYGAERGIPALVQRTADRHYTKLAAILAGDLSADDTHPFNLPEYRDVRERPAYLADLAERNRLHALEQAAAEERRRIEALANVAREAEAEALAADVGMLVDEKLSLMTAGAVAHFLRQLADDYSVEIGDMFEDELHEAEDAAEDSGRESGYEDGRESGYEAASQDMYSLDSVDEMIAEAKTEWEAEQETSDGFAAECYAKGFEAGRIGSLDTLDKARTSNGTWLF